MKRIITFLIACMFCLSGCAFQTTNSTGDEVGKKSRIEIFSMQDELLSTIDNEDTIDNLLNSNDWQEATELPDGLIPAYKLLVYQEKTLLAGQDPNEERDYELIETIIMFEDSPYVIEVISSEVVKNMMLPSDVLTFYYELPGSTIENIINIINS